MGPFAEWARGGHIVFSDPSVLKVLKLAMSPKIDAPFLFRIHKCRGSHGVRFPDMVGHNIGANPLATRVHRTFHRYIGAG